MTGGKNSENILEVKNLRIKFSGHRGETLAVKNSSFCVKQNESLAIVGESGSGKTVTAMSFTRLLPDAPQCQVSGEIIYNSQDILKADDKTLRQIRGKEIAYIFQEPSTSLNPVFSVGWQIEEAVRLHFPNDKNPRKTAIQALGEVGIRDPHLRYDSYPHELSGGMQQRVMIAMALACKPKLLVADEPTTALDVTVQKQIIDLLKEIRAKSGMSLVLITHNFGIISELCENLIVMFRGEIVEEGLTREVLANPSHPYTRALIKCVPRMNSDEKLSPIDYSKL